MRKDKHPPVSEKFEDTKRPPGPVEVHPVVGSLFGLFFVLFSLGVFYQNLANPDCQLPPEAASWKSASGNVVRSISHYRRGGNWYAITVQYQVEGKSYQFDDKSDAKIEKSELKYDATSPSHFFRAQTIEERNSHILTALFCFLGGSYGVFDSVNNWRARLKSFNMLGTVLFAAVLAIFICAYATGHTYPGLDLPESKRAYGVARVL